VPSSTVPPRTIRSYCNDRDFPFQFHGNLLRFGKAHAGRVSPFGDG